MSIFRTIAGYTFGHADIVRRAMSKKKADVMIAEFESFIAGCASNGVSADAAAEIFEEMVGFAKYAFNKSHATAYGVISFRTAYLKAHYPAEYFSALLTSVLGDASKLREYIADAHKHGVSVLPPDINSSDTDFSVSNGNIRYGLLAIKNVGRTVAVSIINERNKKPFTSFDEFVSRMSGADLNKRTLESLIKCGVFDSLGITRSALMSCYETILETEHDKARNNISGQLDMFSIGFESANTTSSVFEYPDIPEYSLRELLMLEKESSGMYFSGHMMDNYSKHAESLGVDKISNVIPSDDSEDNRRYEDRQAVKLAGIITEKKTKVIKNGDTMAFIKLEDRYGEVEVIVFAKQYTAFSSEIFEENAVFIEGTVSYEDGDEVRILLSNIRPLTNNAEFNSAPKAVETSKKEEALYVRVQTRDTKCINVLTRMALLNPGNARIIVYEMDSKGYSAFKDVKISSSEKVIARLKTTFGEANVILK